MYFKYLILLLIALLLSCGDNSPEPDQIVAKVGDDVLLRDIVLQLIPENLSSSDREYFIKQIVEQWVDSHTFAAAAKDEGLSLSARERWQLDKLEAEFLAKEYLKLKIRDDIPVTDREIEDYYEANPEQFRRYKDEVHLIHLYFEQLDNAIVEEIRNSKDLQEVVRNNYLDVQITRAVEPNGDLGYLPVEQLRPEFQKAVRGTKTGIIYGPVKTADGYHYLQVIDRQDAGTLRSISLVSAEIRQLLVARKRQERIQALKEDMRKSFKAETFYGNIL